MLHFPFFVKSKLSSSWGKCVHPVEKTQFNVRQTAKVVIGFHMCKLYNTWINQPPNRCDFISIYSKCCCQKIWRLTRVSSIKPDSGPWSALGTDFGEFVIILENCGGLLQQLKWCWWSQDVNLNYSKEITLILLISTAVIKVRFYLSQNTFSCHGNSCLLKFPRK